MNAPFSPAHPATLANLARRPLWVAWQTEERGPAKKRTKVPYAPSGGKARSNDPTTWGARDAAEARAAKLPLPCGAGGIGLELADLGNGFRMGGIDLDTCRDAAGTLAPWAAEVVERFGTYAEISPSGTGVKLFFLYPESDLPALRAATGTDWGNSWKNGPGEHPPAIELHLGGRYYAVTGKHLAGTPSEFETIPAERLLWVIREAGPRFAGTAKTGASGPESGGEARGDIAARIEAKAGQWPNLAKRWGGDWEGLQDQSRSARAFALGAALKTAGFHHADIDDALSVHPDTREWRAAATPRDLDRIHARAGGQIEHTAPPDRRRPLHRVLPPAPVFPLEGLGNLRHAAEAVHMLTQAPLAMCAQSVLAAATLAIQAHHDVVLPGSGCRPLTGIFASVAESGERKSSVDRRALAPVYDAERRWGEASMAADKQYQIDRAAWSGACEGAKRKCKGDRAALTRMLEEIGHEPKAPPSPMLLVGDATPEGLVMHLASGRPWGGLFTAEGGLLIGGSAFNDETRMRTGALLNTLWDGDPIRRRRVGTGATYLPGRRCTAHVMMQAVVSNRLLGDADLDGIGLLARVLLVAPESTAGTRMFRPPTAPTLATLDDYGHRLGDLLDRTPRTREANPDALDPIPLELSQRAKSLFVAFHDRAEGEMGSNGGYAPIRAFAAKMAEHAGRLAAVLTVYADPEAREVTADAMAGGVELAQHYAAEMLRLKGGAAVAPDLRLAGYLLEWWQRRPTPRLHLAEIYQRGLNAIGDAKTARRIVTVLEEHGWISRLPTGTEIDGAARRDAWELLP